MDWIKKLDKALSEAGLKIVFEPKYSKQEADAIGCAVMDITAKALETIPDKKRRIEVAEWLLEVQKADDL